ncbi:multidrug effflux MFS transporter [Legionella sp. CNM-4043-24]|uniref:multidrug effflux MFS transporter n=1 Tax=Legionella sp. CNM-4043-24 TaxID=3421646 RepID=UPI00403ADA8A
MSKRVLPSIFFLIILQQVAIDIYLPALPTMAEYFQVTPANIQHSLIFYLLGFGLSPLVAGPLSDSFGRKPILIGALLLYLAASLGCAETSIINVLLFCRLLQGIASGALQISTSAMAWDITSGESLAILSSRMSACWAVITMVAPVAGGYILTWFGWRANFYAIFYLALVVFVFVLLGLPESHRKRKTNTIKNTLRIYRRSIRNRRFIGYILLTGLSFSLTIAFYTIAPFIYQTVFAVSPIRFGWLLLLVAACYLSGTLVNARLIRKIPVERAVLYGLYIMLVSSALMLFFMLFSWFTALSVSVPIFLLIFGQGFIFPNALAMALCSLRGNVATSMALLTTGQMMLIGLIGYLTTMLSIDSADELTTLLVLIVILMMALFFIINDENRKSLG